MEKFSLSCETALPAEDQARASELQIPGYLRDAYWWAYLHPNSIRVFERQWVVNLILWGNFNRLRDAALDELGAPIAGRTLQVACVYGDFTEKLSARLGATARLDVVDIAQVQLLNTRKKTLGRANVSIHRQDASCLHFPDACFDNTVLFFLLHEQPEAIRRATIAEAVRVTRKGGKIVFVDYHRPARWNPIRYLMAGIFKLLEPYAENFWAREILDWAPPGLSPKRAHKRLYFGGLYQKTVLWL